MYSFNFLIFNFNLVVGGGHVALSSWSRGFMFTNHLLKATLVLAATCLLMVFKGVFFRIWFAFHTLFLAFRFFALAFLLLKTLLKLFFKLQSLLYFDRFLVLFHSSFIFSSSLHFFSFMSPRP